MFLLRCTVDTETMTYYHAPLFASLVAWDALRGERLPLRGLAAVGVSYVVFDRLGVYGVSPDVQAFAYLATTLGLALALAATLFLRPAAGKTSALTAGDAAPGLGRPAQPQASC